MDLISHMSSPIKKKNNTARNVAHKYFKYLLSQQFLYLVLQVISGQYVSSNHTASTYIEVEIIGIPVDCAKHKTKIVSRNALNPIWNDIINTQVSQ